MKEITSRQQEILDFVSAYIDDNAFPPSAREIADNFKMSPKGAHDHLMAIEKKGFIKITPHIARGIRIIGKEV